MTLTPSEYRRVESGTIERRIGVGADAHREIRIEGLLGKRQALVGGLELRGIGCHARVAALRKLDERRERLRWQVRAAARVAHA